MKLVPKTFVRRVGNLLDRGIGITPERRAGQRGIFQEYEFNDIVELSIGLSLQNASMPQSDIVHFLVGFRTQIREQIALMPASAEGQFGTFLIIQPFGLGETQRPYRHPPTLAAAGVAFFEPQFISDPREWAKLPEEFGKISSERIVIEIGDVAGKLHEILEKAPASNRGR